MISYMIGKLAPNSSHLTRGLVKSVPGRGCFRAVPSQHGDKYVTSLPTSIVELVFTSMCLLLDVGFFTIAIASSLSTNMSRHIPASCDCRKTKTSLSNVAYFAASKRVTHSVSHVVVVTHFCVLLFQIIAVSPRTTAITDLQTQKVSAQNRARSLNQSLSSHLRSTRLFAKVPSNVAR